MNETLLEKLKNMMAEREDALQRWGADPNWGALHDAALDALPALISAVKVLAEASAGITADWWLRRSAVLAPLTRTTGDSTDASECVKAE